MKKLTTVTIGTVDTKKLVATDKTFTGAHAGLLAGFAIVGALETTRILITWGRKGYCKIREAMKDKK